MFQMFVAEHMLGKADTLEDAKEIMEGIEQPGATIIEENKNTKQTRNIFSWMMGGWKQVGEMRNI